jgi:hypothetical protein
VRGEVVGQGDGGEDLPVRCVISEVRRQRMGDGVLWRWTSAVVGGDVEGILQLREGKEMVRRGGIEEENRRRRRSPIEEEGGDKSISPGGEVDKRHR